MTAQLPSKARLEERIRAEIELLEISLKNGGSDSPHNDEELLEVFRLALAAYEQEPVAYMCDGDDGREYNGHNEFSCGGRGIPLYTHPAPVPAVPDNWKGQLTGTQCKPESVSKLSTGTSVGVAPAPAVPDDVLTICQRLIKEYIANKGTSSEFICCVTPSRKTIGTGGVWDDWRALDKAVRAAMLNGGKS